MSLNNQELLFEIRDILRNKVNQAVGNKTTIEFAGKRFDIRESGYDETVVVTCDRKPNEVYSFRAPPTKAQKLIYSALWGAMTKHYSSDVSLKDVLSDIESLSVYQGVLTRYGPKTMLTRAKKSRGNGLRFHDKGCVDYRGK